MEVPEFFVRGGAAEQNLILLDEGCLYKAAICSDFSRTFNSDAIKMLRLQGKCNRHIGGRLASCLDVKMNEEILTLSMSAAFWGT